MKFLPYGDRAVLCEVASAAQALALYQQLRAAAVPEGAIGELIPAARTLLLCFDPVRITAEELIAWVVQSAAPSPEVPPDFAGSTLLLPVHYDGEDLAEIAQVRACTIAEVVRWHTDTRWQVCFMGFTPGFGYLASADTSGVVIPRRAVPRVTVPAGAVALADEFCGVYPRESPGGWQLLGRTDVSLWDLRQRTPASLWPGRPVRFVQAG